VHLLRGIPRQAVQQTRSSRHVLSCRGYRRSNQYLQWNGDMYGVDMSKPGAQAYYDSVSRFSRNGRWTSSSRRPQPTLSQSRDRGIRMPLTTRGGRWCLAFLQVNTGREGAHVSQHANMWRISDDFWDKWSELEHQFERCRNGRSLAPPDIFPTPTCSPRVIAQGNAARTSPRRAYTLMTLWSIARSPSSSEATSPNRRLHVLADQQ